MSSCALRVDDVAEPVAAVVVGEVDRTNTEQFVSAVRAVPGPRPFILDLSELSFMDSAGFAALMSLVEQRLIVIVLTPWSLLRRAATVLGLPFQDTVASARNALGIPS
jgi:anti-anti-sigma factor